MIKPRFIVYGAGGIGMLAGGRLKQAGYDVILVGRPNNVNAINSNGLKIVTGSQSETVNIPAISSISELTPSTSDVVLLSVKAHQTEEAINDLSKFYPSKTPVISLQNGLENEKIISTHFKTVISSVVIVFGMYLKDGVVDSGCWKSPTGYYEFGYFCRENSEILHTITTAFREADFIVHLPESIKNSQYAKLLVNLCNAIPALTNKKTSQQMSELIISEGERIFQANSVDFEKASSLLERFKKLTGKPFVFTLADGSPYLGSTWQSLIMGKTEVETPFFNGLIEILGKNVQLPTPINSLLNRLVTDMAKNHQFPGLYTEEQILEMINELSR